MQQTFAFDLPSWVKLFVSERGERFPTEASRVELAIELSAENIAQGTGGPFGAAVFDEDGLLLSVGVNLVPTSNCSILHAEMVALALAQKSLGRYDLGDGGLFPCELAASTEPCAMCFGAVPWSGVTRLLCGARDEDARAVGFDEGAKLNDWPSALAQRKIEVVRDVMREKASAVLRRYADESGIIY
jgi:tRNA(Arg) A34 adenosine deaminase TadA